MDRKMDRRIEKETLALPQLLVWQPFGAFKAFEGCIPAEKETPALPESLAAPRPGLARFEGFEAFGAFKAFEGSIRQFRARRKGTLPLPQPLVWQPFGAFKAFEGCIPAEKETPALPEPLVWRLQDPVWHVSKGFEAFGAFKAFEGSIRH